MFDPLLHAPEPYARPQHLRAWIEALTVVGHREIDPV